MRRAEPMRRPETESGITLVELLVSMMLLGLILAMASGLYSSVVRSVSISRSLDSSTRVASTAANELGQVIRFGTTLKVAGSSIAAPAFSFAGRESLVLFSNTDVNAFASVAVRPPKPTMIRFSIDPTSRALIESRWTATASGAAWVFAATTTPPNSSLNLGSSFVDPGAGAPLFSYFDSSGVVIAAPTTGSMVSADLARIATVLLTVRVQGNGGAGAAPVVIENTVEVVS